MNILQSDKRFFLFHHEKLFRGLLVGVLPLFIYLDNFAFPNINLSFLYVIIMIIVAFAFHRIWIYALFSGICLGSKYLFKQPTDTDVFILYGITWFGLAVLVQKLLNDFDTQRKNIIALTKAMAKLLDSRDEYTSFHSEHVAENASKIAKELGLPPKECDHIFIGGKLHDIGKIGLPEGILLKPTRLTAEEFNIIKNHPTVGYEVLKNIPYFKINGILEMVLYHHEKYDGTGYPLGLKGDQIPLSARIIAVADSFDAMITRRVYREKMGMDYAILQLKEHSGTQFDPQVVEAFLKVLAREHPSIVNRHLDLTRFITSNSNWL